MCEEKKTKTQVKRKKLSTKAKMNSFLLYSLFFVAFLGFAGAGQESTLSEAFQLPQTTHLYLAVTVSDNKTITEISSSITKAETWLKTHVLSRYPSTKITTIVVFSPDPCQATNQNHILPSLKNLHHSLKRWGLEKNIKVSYGFSYKCLKTLQNLKHDLDMFKDVFTFLKAINSTFTINPPQVFLSSPHNHLVEMFGFLTFHKVNILNPEPEHEATRRSLKSLRKLTVHLPTLPSPSPENSYPPTTTTNPSPPNLELPPCLPPSSPAPAPVPAKRKYVQGEWCIAKPTVAAETLQQSLDYACGQGGANCDEIKPHGSCYYPDTVMAHASYAFNSYWQKNKRNGGTCSFGGTAILIATDPSYQHCKLPMN